ncbi:Aste57867_11047 [Aphanomyces stellatus]|uniref:Aste57867_11047 protein n=1 Tax=Aphanomyces stellatus TaxID=120398 RepID=A0A485KSG2_9STRA|nr:hypothetical protein As57867_011005 [Aphanomyces stellatus]VFT87915.1 Aste57867_11047 [Aphanomyces stellatus]
MAAVVGFGGYGSFGEMVRFESDEGDVIAIAAGHTVSFAALAKTLVGWGKAFHGELPTPSPVRWSLSVQSIACGGSHVLVCTTSGACLTWGHHFYREILVPKEVALPTLPSGKHVHAVEVAAGESHSLVLDTDGHVYSWGSNAYGQCGVDETEDATTVFLVSMPTAKCIAAGTNHSAVVTTTGLLYTFGWGLYHQLGQGTTENVSTPTCVQSLEGVGAFDGQHFSGLASVACGAWHTAALTTTGDVYTWGWGQHGQLGHATLTSQPHPALLDVEFTATAIACGTRHTTVLAHDGVVHRWGFVAPCASLVAGKSDAPNTTHTVVPNISTCKHLAAGAYHDLLVV